VPGATPAARRKYLDRAIKIAEIWPEAKSAAEAAGLDNTQSALLAVARESSLPAQLSKVQEIAARKAMPRRKSTGRNRGEGTVVAPDAKSAPAAGAVATGAELAGSLAPPPIGDEIPPFFDRRPVSIEDQRVFEAIMAALHSASVVVRERVRAALVRQSTSSRSAADPIDRGRGSDHAGAIPGAMPSEATANVESTQAPRTRRVPGHFEEPPF
jgi:hypothetical protein